MEKIALGILELLDPNKHQRELLREILFLLRHQLGFESVAIRLQEGDDYPYYEYDGFSDQFIKAESRLCALDKDGKIIRDGNGNPVLDCMCGNVLQGRTDPSFPFFTEAGSFWSNGTTKLLASTSEEDRQARTRNRCNGEGYESVALIPLRSGKDVVGLLQLNDRKENRFAEEMVQQMEVIGSSLGVALGRIRAEESLRVSEKHYRSLYESMGEGVSLNEMIYDESGKAIDYRIVDVNPAYEKILGTKRDEVVGALASKFYKAGEPPFLDRYANVSETQLPDSFEVYFQPKDKHFSINVFSPGKGSFAAVFTDITGRKKAEEEKLRIEGWLRHQQKLESIGTLASGVAHEINNPINGILNYAQLISNRLQSDSPLQDFTKEILFETNRVATIVKDLLAFSRQDTEAHSPARIVDIVNSTMSLVRNLLKKDQIEFVMEVSEALPRIECRSQQVQQILMNLITNARDALNTRYPQFHENKKIAITSRLLSRDGLELVRTTIEDRGFGISPNIIDRIFDPFFTTKSRDMGTGLGLAVSYGIAKEHKGDLLVESEFGEGTRFHLDLPVYKNRKSSSESIFK